MDKMWESKFNHNGGSDKDVGSDLRFKVGKKERKRGEVYIHEQDEMSLIVQSNTLINPWFKFSWRVTVLKVQMTYTNNWESGIRVRLERERVFLKKGNPLYSLDSDDRTWKHIYCIGDNGELSKLIFVTVTLISLELVKKKC